MVTAKETQNIPQDLQALAAYLPIERCTKTECILEGGQRLSMEDAKAAAASLKTITDVAGTTQKIAGRFAASAKDFLAKDVDARMRKLGEAFLGLEKCIGQCAASECLAQCTENSIKSLIGG